ncbi:MAG: DNA-deoxyinosine glycosylase [Clostridia bacterium]|jgi:hypoxanthine-DNA glycosylase|nr:DNA-deoxyinosine glycosylase [Clostridia bacterium]MDD4572018.1 DNA-deoxyinosine glycosylase [Clostridia bacterium]
MAKEHLFHNIEPVYNANSRILMLGSFPSPKSREMGFYYGHPQNIFWPTIAQALGKKEPEPTATARKGFALANGIALWDVLASCEIKGAADSSIANAVPNDINKILRAADIKAIFTTGKTATALYNKYCLVKTGRKTIYLPSTSPANRALQKTTQFWESWSQIQNYLCEK